MIALLLLLAVGLWTIWREQSIDEISNNLMPQKLSDKLDKLWVIAQESLRDRRYLRAEKALLTILRVDERNASAYNRLGILYAKQQAFNDAIECFEIAQSLEPSPSSLHNVGLIYYETKQYDKAEQAFEQAINMEDDVASRHIAYAKVQEKLGDNRKMIVSLERALQIEPSIQAFKILADAYEHVGEIEKSENLRAKINQVLSSKKPAVRKISQVRKVQL